MDIPLPVTESNPADKTTSFSGLLSSIGLLAVPISLLGDPDLPCWVTFFLCLPLVINKVVGGHYNRYLLGQVYERRQYTVSNYTTEHVTTFSQCNFVQEFSEYSVHDSIIFIYTV